MFMISYIQKMTLVTIAGPASFKMIDVFSLNGMLA